MCQLLRAAVKAAGNMKAAGIFEALKAALDDSDAAFEANDCARLGDYPRRRWGAATPNASRAVFASAVLGRNAGVVG
jgi:hypothetical protein